MKILLTGASGFVGKAVFIPQMHDLIIRTVYRSMDSANGQTEAALVFELDAAVDWSQALQGVNLMIHASAHARIMREEAVGPSQQHRYVYAQAVGRDRRSYAQGADGVSLFHIHFHDGWRQGIWSWSESKKVESGLRTQDFCGISHHG